MKSKTNSGEVRELANQFDLGIVKKRETRDRVYYYDRPRSGMAGISGPDDGGLCPWGDVGQRHVDSGDSIDLDSLFRILQSPISK